MSNTLADVTSEINLIAKAVMEKEGSSETMTFTEIKDRIAAIQTGGGSAVSNTPPVADPLIWIDAESYGTDTTQKDTTWANKGTLTDVINTKTSMYSTTADAVFINNNGAVCCNFSETYNDFTMYTVMRVHTRSGADTDAPLLGADGTTDTYVKLAFIAQSATSIRATLRSYSGDLAYYPHAEQYAILAITCRNGEQIAYVNGCPFLRQTNASNFSIRNICHKCKYTADDPIGTVGANMYYIKATLAYNAAHTFDEVVAMSDWLRAKYLAK